MRKTNKNLTKQILTLMLAFIMIFTGMGIGSWGVDEAAAANLSHTVNEVIGITSADIPNDATGISSNLPIAGEGTKVGTYKGYNLYYIGLEEKYNEVKVNPGCIVTYKNADGLTTSFTNYQAVAAKNVDLNQSTDTLKDFIANGQSITQGNTLYNAATTFYTEAKEAIQWSDSGMPNPDETYVMLSLYSTEIIWDPFSMRVGKIAGFLIVKLGQGIKTTTTGLDEALKTAPDMANDKAYYHKDDGYNGKTTVNELVDNLSENETIKKDADTLDKIKAGMSGGASKPQITGFWNLYQVAMNRVNEIYPATNDGTRTLLATTNQDQIDAAAALLDSAIANLIPKTQLNATYLYETVQSRGNYSEEYLETCTDVSAAAYREIADKARAYLKSLFDEELVSADNPNGATAENIATNQEKADGYADELKKFIFLSKEDVTNATWNLKTISGLAKQYDMTKNNGKYTGDSWDTFVTARKAAVDYAKEHPVSNSMEAAEVKEYAKLARAFQAAAYGLTPAKEKEKEKVTVTFIYTDDYHLRWVDIKEPIKSWTKDPENNKVQKQTVELTSGATLAELWNQTCMPGNDYLASNSYSIWHTFVNGRMLYGYTPGVQQYFADTNYVLKDGDEIQLVHMDWPTFAFNYIYRDEVKWDKMADILGMFGIAETKESSQSAAAGEDIKLTVERTSAHLWSYTGSYSAYEGATLAVYGPMNDDGTYPQTPILSEKTSDADGKVSIKLYKPGKYLVTAYDARENNEDKSLFYSGTVAAPYMELTVADADDTSKIRAELKKELDKVYNACKDLDLNYDGTKKDKDGNPEPEYFTKEEKSQIDKAYEDAAKVLGSSTSTADESHRAQQKAIKEIREIQDAAGKAHEAILAVFRENLNKLPGDETLITKGEGSIAKTLLDTYASMNAYQQKKLVTKVEYAKYEKIKNYMQELAAAGKDLPDAKKYELNLLVKADTEEAEAVINKMITYLRENPAKMDRAEGGKYDHTKAINIVTPFTFGRYDGRSELFAETFSEAYPLTAVRLYTGIDYAAYFQTRNASGSFTTNDGWTISDENLGIVLIAPTKGTVAGFYSTEGHLSVKVGDTAYELKSISYEGLEKDAVISDTQRVYDDSGYKEKDTDTVNIDIPDAYLGFTMPYNDVTITLNWAPVTTKAELDAAKDAATSVLDEAFAKYEKNKTSYGDNWEKLQEAYNDGIQAIKAATTIGDVAQARKDAVTAMSKVTKPGQAAPSADSLGTVHVIVENTKFTKEMWGEGKTFWDGTLVDTDVELKKDSTMMSCVVDALKTVNATQIGAENNYISSIADSKGNALAEFDGGPSSGWMGTLNDWFNNEGFGNFTVANGALGDGDEIRIMYTTKGYGEDLGGSWANSNTTLKDLSVSGGTLTPSFTSGTSGGSYDYTLLISGKTANIKVTPTAANKNFLTKIFLNEKVTSNVQGSSFYKRTQYIPVTAGDTIYVGCGERRWPSMNNQAGNTQANGGTWYALKVVNSSNAKDTIEKAIAELPDADKIKIGNYKNTKDAAKDIRDLYNSLSSTVQNSIEDTKLAKLKAVEEKVKFYSEIQEAKDKLDALTDSSSKSEAKAASDAFEKLTDEQKKYITEADAAKFNELAKKYNLSTITGAAAMPESEVETTGSVGSAVTSSPTTVKMSGTTATVTVKADNQKEILKQAKEKKSAQVVLAIANSDAKGAEKLELNLDKSFLESLLKDTSAKLVVKTPLGQKTYEREELQKLVNEATGTTVKAEINKDNVDTAVEEPTDDNANIEKAKSIVKNMKLTARSSKTAKKNIKAVLKSDAKVNASIKELKDLGFTVKYRFYRSTKKAASYKSAVTKKTASYTNTSGKKGTKYFYKVQVRVYDENAKLVAKTALKQCKYASRTWTKAK